MNKKVFIILCIIIVSLIGCSKSNEADTNENTSKETEKLVYSIINGENEKVKEYIQSGIDVNMKTDRGFTLLMLAIEAQQYETALLLVELGAKIDYAHYGSNQLLMYATDWGHKELVEMLLKRDDYDVNEADQFGKTPLLSALALNNSEELIEVLIKNGANCNYVDENGKAALHYAIQTGNSKIVQSLLKCSSDTNVQDKDGVTPLMLTSLFNFPELTKILVKQSDNVKVDLRDQKGRTALYFAAENGLTEIVEILINAGANVNIVAKDGRTPLLEAKQWGHSETEKLLIKHGAVK